METLLLTATIKPSNNILGKNSDQLNFQKRKKEYITALIYYISESNFNNIVFVENSDTYLEEFESLKILAKTFNKDLEILIFKGKIELSEKYSYGCGEAEIFDYFFENSILLKNSKSFIKISGRYIVEDINKIIENLKNIDNYFFRPWLIGPLFSVATSFFKISKKNYEKYLYKKIINFYTKYNTGLSLEKMCFLLLKDILLKNNFPNSINIVFKYPIFGNNFGIFGKGILRKLIYLIYYKTGIHIYQGLFIFLDKIFFDKYYQRMQKNSFPDSI